MSIEILRATLGWSALLHTALILFWWLLLVFARDWVYKMHTRWFKLTPEAFDAVHYAGIGFYKILLWAFFLIPWIALHIVD